MFIGGAEGCRVGDQRGGGVGYRAGEDARAGVKHQIRRNVAAFEGEREVVHIRIGEQGGHIDGRNQIAVVIYKIATRSRNGRGVGDCDQE